ncbi:MAG TPA: ribbon-helix-helix protein, CopG family [Polyangiaceae bacterium]|nr:ribbon-helix-helix protein, CopG family [Polyangiaceae bacterium]
MKTAVSLPDEIFQRASKEAKRLGISRSELVARALREYLRDRSSREVRASYDRAFGEDAGPDDATELRREAARRALQDVEW